MSTIKFHSQQRLITVDMNDLNQKSEWFTRKSRNDNLAHLQLIQNRIQMLQIENEKKLKRTEVCKNKLLIVQKIRIEQEEQFQMKAQFKLETENALRQLKHRTETEKMRARENIQSNKKTLQQQRSQDYIDIKVVQQANESAIRSERLENRQVNSSKRSLIRDEEEMGQKKMRDFRTTLQMKFMESHNQSKVCNLTESLFHSQQTQMLEKKELQLLNSLHASQEAFGEANSMLRSLYSSKNLNLSQSKMHYGRDDVNTFPIEI